MSDDSAPEEATFDGIRIVLNLERFGELVAHVAAAFAAARDIDPPDFDGQEMRHLAVSSWKHVCFMADREEFKQSVSSTLEQLGSPPAETAPQHRPEFGFFEPPV